MSSVLSTSSFSLQQRPSPLALLQQNLTSSISSGKIESADETALSKALDLIDSAMQADRASRSGGSRPSPGEGKAKVEGMIDDLVTDGTLTEAQATELKQLFEETFAGGPTGRMGPPPPPPEAEGAEGEENGEVTLTLSGASSTIAELLQELIRKFGEAGSSVSYSTSGAKTTSQVSALFVDKVA